MSKQETLVIKGIAILLMLWLHLFFYPEKAALCDNFLFVGDTPLCMFLAKAANSVAWFLVLGGYGLYVVWAKGDKHRYSRIAKLVLRFWLILAIFVSIGAVIKPNKYPGSISTVLYNISGLNTTYNTELWFLLPYVVVSVISPIYFKMISRFKAAYIIAVTFFVYLGSCYCISRYADVFLYRHVVLYNIVLVLQFFFYFSLGAMAARSRFFDKLKSKADRIPRPIKVLIWLGVIGLFIARCIFKYIYGFAFFMIMLILIAPRTKWMDNILITLGKHSMNMWMTHTWFCAYLFMDFVYSFKFPPVIFIVLVLLSFGSSIVINMIAKPMETYILPWFEKKPITISD